MLQIEVRNVGHTKYPYCERVFFKVTAVAKSRMRQWEKLAFILLSDISQIFIHLYVYLHFQIDL